MLVLNDVLEMYMKKFNLDEEPILPMGSAEEAIEMLMIAIDTNKKLKFDWDKLEPKEYKLQIIKIRTNLSNLDRN